MFYNNGKIGRWCEDQGHPGHVFAAPTPLLDGQGEQAYDEDGIPLYTGADRYEVRGWDAAWTALPTDAYLDTWTPPKVQLNPVTDVEILQQTVQSRLDGDEEKRTGVRPNPTGAVPLSRSWAATAMLYGGWHYPSEEDLATGANPAILAAIYADPTTNTTAESPVDQKRRVLHFTLVMLEGQAFGLEYQSQLGAYERTASGAIREAIAADQRDWLDLPCHTWESVRAMFLDLLK